MYDRNVNNGSAESSELEDGEHVLALLPMALARFSLDPGSPFPIYEQICQCIRVAISAGELPSGTMLPPARVLAERLKVGRNTVVTSYSRLAAEGYVTSNTRRGTRVADTPTPQPAHIEHLAREDAPSSPAMPARGISFRAWYRFQTSANSEADAAWNAVGLPDPSLYPRVNLARLLNEEFSRPISDESACLERFQVAISSLLRHMRGIRCVPKQIIPIASPGHALDLVTRLMIDPGDCVYVEDPLDPVIRQSLQASGAQLVNMPCDGQGADIGKVSGPPPRLVVVSPSANFPFGRQMSELRRKALIEFAEARGAAILEWDRCWNLSYSGARSAALQAQARHAAVVYFDSFYESLGAHLRLGYLAVPESLVQPFTRIAEQMASWPSAFMLSAVARFLEGNQYNVHVSEVRRTYAQRLRRLSDLCRASLEQIIVVEPNAGHTLVVEFQDGLDDAEICRLAGANLPIAPLSRLYSGAPGVRAGIAIGAGALTERTIDIVVRQIGEAIRQMRASTVGPGAGRTPLSDNYPTGRARAPAFNH